MQEYTYLLNFTMWEFGQEFWDEESNGIGSLTGEWSDDARTPDGVLQNNPLGHQLFKTYFEPVLTKPDITTLKSIFQDNDNGLSGYTVDNETVPSWLTFNASTQTISGTPQDSDLGVVNLKVTATDAAGLSVSDSFKINVVLPNTPTDIYGISGYLESDSSLNAGNLGTVDADQASGHTYTLKTSLDSESFTLTSAGALSFVAQPDYETKSSYSITVETKDADGKIYEETLKVSINDANEAPVITAVGGSVAEGAATNGTVTGTLSGVDPEGMTVTYSAASLTGEYDGQLVLDVATGAYTYTINNDNSSVQDLLLGATLTETFTVSAFDGSISGSGNLSFTIPADQETNDVTFTLDIL